MWIDPLVDLYNAIWLRHVVPASGFDLETVDGLMDLRLSPEGDRFLALDADEPEPVPPGRSPTRWAPPCSPATSCGGSRGRP